MKSIEQVYNETTTEINEFANVINDFIEKQDKDFDIVVLSLLTLLMSALIQELSPEKFEQAKEEGLQALITKLLHDSVLMRHQRYIRELN